MHKKYWMYLINPRQCSQTYKCLMHNIFGTTDFTTEVIFFLTSMYEFPWRPKYPYHKEWNWIEMKWNLWMFWTFFDMKRNLPINPFGQKYGEYENVFNLQHKKILNVLRGLFSTGVVRLPRTTDEVVHIPTCRKQPHINTFPSLCLLLRKPHLHIALANKM